VRTIKETARRQPGTGWNAELGWGILDAGAALAKAAATDRRAPSSRVSKLPARTRRRTITVRWAGIDRSPAGVRASGVSRYELWRSVDGGRPHRILTTKATSRQIRLRGGARYGFSTVAIDRAGNHERAPKRPDAVITRR
jgi:serine protease